MMHTTHTVAVMLRNAEIEKEDELDLWAALQQLPYPSGALIRLYMQGYSPTEAVKKLGLKDNPHRTFVRGLRALRDILNGSEVSLVEQKKEE